MRCRFSALRRRPGPAVIAAGAGRVPPLLDDLVGAGEDRWRDGEAESLGGREIDDQLECRRLLDRQISRLGTFEDSPRVTAGLAKGLSDPHTIADQAAGRRDLAPQIA